MPGERHSTTKSNNRQSSQAQLDFPAVKRQFDETVKEAQALQTEYVKKLEDQQSFIQAAKQLRDNTRAVNNYKANEHFYRRFRDTVQSALAGTDLSSLGKKCDKLCNDLEPQIDSCYEPLRIMVNIFEMYGNEGSARAIKNKDTEALQKAIAAMKSDMEKVRAQK